MAAASLPSFSQFLQSHVNTDVVVWYYGSAHHLVRDEDGRFGADGTSIGEAHIMWTGFMLKPHNLFDVTPLFPDALLPPPPPPPPPNCTAGQRCCEFDGNRCTLCIPNNAQCPLERQRDQSSSRDWRNQFCFPMVEVNKRPTQQNVEWVFLIIPATSYSPTQFPAQYHRLQQA